MDMRTLAAVLNSSQSPFAARAIDDRDVRGAKYEYDDIPSTGCVAVIYQNNRGMMLVRAHSHRSKPTTYSGEYYQNPLARDVHALLKRFSGGRRTRITKYDLLNNPQCTVIGFNNDGAYSDHVGSDVRVPWPYVSWED